MVTVGMTLERAIVEEQAHFPEAKGVLTGLLTQIALAGKIIYSEVNKAGLADILGLTGKVNVQGEEVEKLDDFANTTIRNCLDHGGYLCAMASEEMDEAFMIPERFPAGDYVLLYDPLDGSSNIDVNVNIGTIFSVFRKKSRSERGEPGDCLRKGAEQVAAGYVIYGSSVMLVYTTGNGVNGFTLDPRIGEFFLSHPDIKTPPHGTIYSINEGNTAYWAEETRRYISYLKEVDKGSGRPYSGRYIGSLVADFHRNLLKGGVFLYPADKRNPEGKLRLLYECNPLAFIVEQAGGAASDGKRRILDVVPQSLHQRTPLIIGSRENVALAEQFFQGKR
ncbi:MAG: class 1 fructose-bisphosphatase [Candidatus Tectomicrobia bacterium]|nr:class 1 fructose-bisphosphatase [Candidatus Tectomicrobia bacterium]